MLAVLQPTVSDLAHNLGQYLICSSAEPGALGLDETY